MASDRFNLKLGSPINTDKWIAENKASFVPPVCNKLMYGAGQLKVMFVGGPNTRNDYHIEEGEELFFMVKGDMCLKVMEKGKPKDVVIKEGEIFLLPCNTPHSPQRFENTVGLVIERFREEKEQDCLRWYCDDQTTNLFETWFHCNDLGKDLVPIVKSFFASEQCKTGKPIPGTIGTPPFEIDVTTTMKDPFCLKKWIDQNADEIKANGSKVLLESKQTKVVVYGLGENSTDEQFETWLWQFDGSADLNCNGIEHSLNKSDVLLIPAGTKFSCERSKPDSFTISVNMERNLK